MILFKKGKKGKVEINIFVNHLTFSLKMKDNQEKLFAGFLPC